MCAFVENDVSFVEFQFMKKIQYYVDYNNKQNTFEKMTIILF